MPTKHVTVRLKSRIFDQLIDELRVRRLTNPEATFTELLEEKLLQAGVGK